MEEKIARFFIVFAKMYQASCIHKPYHLALTELALPDCVPPAEKIRLSRVAINLPTIFKVRQKISLGDSLCNYCILVQYM
jgi:hypothetical protein